MNGYINIELGGQQRGLKFGNRMLLDVMKKHQVDANIKMSFDLIVDLVFGALMNNCERKKVDPDFTYEEVEQWVDDMPMTKMTEIFSSFTSSFGEDGKEVAKTTATRKKL